LYKIIIFSPLTTLITMAVDTFHVLDIIEVMEAFLERKRPPEAIRHKVDVGYDIDGQSVIIHEIRSSWEDSSKIIYPEIAKATFVKARNHWKVFWPQADLKWHSYEPDPTVETLADFVMVVEVDEHGCFWG
jgi:spore coat polysaccharide biosynthesis protein SpsF (cytidylyltransferase family)